MFRTICRNGNGNLTERNIKALCKRSSKANLCLLDFYKVLRSVNSDDSQTVDCLHSEHYVICAEMYSE